MNAQIAQRLAEGDPVVLFGEGTAGDGNRVMPFRTALIGAARDAIASAGNVAQVWIQPLSIAYVSQQGIPLGRHLRPRAAWYGKMKLTSHIGALIRTGAVDVTVTWGEPIAYDGATDRKVIGTTAGIVCPGPDASRRCEVIAGEGRVHEGHGCTVRTSASLLKDVRA